MIARVLRGGECVEEGAIFTRSAPPWWALAMSKGLESPAQKTDPNEDACGVASGGIGSLAVVADAHFGRASAEIVVDHMLSVALQDPPPRSAMGDGEVPRWLRARLETACGRVRAQRSSTACAVLAVVIQGHRLWWVSMGDCRLYLIRDAESIVCNRLNNIYLGDRDKITVEEGSVNLRPGDQLILASDGLPECRYGRETLYPSDVGRCVAGLEPEAAARALVEAALAGGGEDNIAVAVSMV
ncbi:MAG: serine/threonine protein phosphatase PrpC [Myxococcota bacterium]